MGRRGGPWGPRELMPWLLLLVLLSGAARGMYVERTFTTQYYFFVFEKFGFEQGATMNISIDYEPVEAHLNFLLCSDTEMLSFPSNTDLCRAVTDIRCTVNEPLPQGGHYGRSLFPVPQTERYQFLMSNCERLKLTVHVEGSFVNPGGQHLSTAHYPLPALLAVMTCLWVALLAAWLLNWLLSGMLPPHLHRLLTLVPFLKVAALVCAVLYWLWLSDAGSAPEALGAASYATDLAFNAAFAAAILLVAEGWTITRLTVGSAELRAFAVTVTGLCLASLFYQLLGGYYLFAILIMTVVFFRFAFSSLRQNLRGLKAQLRVLQQHPGTTLELLLREKHTALKSPPDPASPRCIQRLLTLYAVIQALTLFFITFFLASSAWVEGNKAWLEALLRETSQLVFFAGTCYALRLRKIKTPDEGGLAALKNTPDDPAVIGLVPPFSSSLAASRVAVRQDAVDVYLGEAASLEQEGAGPFTEL